MAALLFRVKTEVLWCLLWPAVRIRTWNRRWASNRLNTQCVAVGWNWYVYSWWHWIVIGGRCNCRLLNILWSLIMKSLCTGCLVLPCLLAFDTGRVIYGRLKHQSTWPGAPLRGAYALLTRQRKRTQLVMLNETDKIFAPACIKFQDRGKMKFPCRTMLPFCQMCSIAIKTYLNQKVYYQLGREIIMVGFHTESVLNIINMYVFM